MMLALAAGAKENGDEVKTLTQLVAQQASRIKALESQVNRLGRSSSRRSLRFLSPTKPGMRSRSCGTKPVEDSDAAACCVVLLLPTEMVL